MERSEIEVDDYSECNRSLSDSSETPSELEARLYSIIHHNDLTQKLPSDIAAQFSVDVSGHTVSVTLNKEFPPLEMNALNNMSSQSSEFNTEMTKADSSSCDSAISVQNSDDSSCNSIFSACPFDKSCESSNVVNNSKISRMYKSSHEESTTETNALNISSQDFQRDIENNQVNEKPGTKMFRFYLSYVAWHNNYEKNSFENFKAGIIEQLLRMKTLQTHSNNLHLIRKIYDEVEIAKALLKKTDTTFAELRKLFCRFVKEVCAHKMLSFHESNREFKALLSKKNRPTFYQNFKALRDSFSVANQQALRPTQSSILDLSKKFKSFLEKSCSQGLPFHQAFTQFKNRCTFKDLLLLMSKSSEQHLNKEYQNFLTHTVVSDVKTHSHEDENLSSSDDECDAPLKKRRLNPHSEQSELKCLNVTNNKISKPNNFKNNDLLIDLCYQYNPHVHERDVILNIFRQFYKCCLEQNIQVEKECRKSNFEIVFDEFKDNSNYIFSLCSNLINIDFFKDVYSFHEERSMKSTERNEKIVVNFLNSLVKKALPKCVPPSHSSSDVKKQTNSTVPDGKLCTSQEDCSSKTVYETIIIDDSDDNEVLIDDTILQKSPGSEKKVLNDSALSESFSSLPPVEENISFSQDSTQVSTPCRSSDFEKYSRSCPPSWSKKLVSFYRKSWGGETFDHAELLKDIKKSSSPSDWRIFNQLDLMPKNNRKRSKKCTRCLQYGHLSYYCQEPLRPVVCSTCGGHGHFRASCRNNICFSCGKNSKMYSEACNECKSRVSSQRSNCEFCKSSKHSHENCSDLWRSYHSTVSGELSPPTNVEVNPRKYCCNCGKKGHLDYFCPNNKGRVIINNPFVQNYNVEYFCRKKSGRLSEEIKEPGPYTSFVSFNGKVSRYLYPRKNIILDKLISLHCNEGIKMTLVCSKGDSNIGIKLASGRPIPENFKSKIRNFVLQELQ